MRKVIVFEEIHPKNRWLVFVYIWRGYDVIFFRMHRSLRASFWLNKFMTEKKIAKVNFNPRLQFIDGISDTDAFESLEHLYPEFLKKNRFLNNLKRLYKNPDIELAFKNILFKKLTRFYYLNRNMSQIARNYKPGSRELLFLPFKTFPVYQTLNNDIHDYFLFKKLFKNVSGSWLYPDRDVNFTRSHIFYSYLRYFLQRLFFCFKIPAFLAFLSFRSRSERKPPGVYRYGFMMITPRQFENEIKSVDFLIDGKEITKDDVIFIPYKRLNEQHRKAVQGKQLNNVKDPQKRFDTQYLKRAVPYLLGLIGIVGEKDLDALENYLKLVFYYVKWGSVSEKVTLTHLISQNTDNVNQALARDIIFKNKGTTIWKYMDSASLLNYVVPLPEFLRAKENIFVYMYCDHLVSWSDDNNQVFSTTRSKIGNYWTTGCLWSEHVRLIEEKKIPSALQEKLQKADLRQDMKVVGMFDSSFHEDMMSTYEDGIAFLKAVQTILKQFPSVYVVLKEKKPWSAMFKECPEAKVLYEELKNTPRVFLTGNKTSTSEVIALSDLVISFSFTSTALEALGVRKKSIWFDPTNKFQHMYYDQVPGLVCHGETELIARMKELLFKTTAEQYEKYIQDVVRPFCLSFADGQGLSRFRKLLKNEKYISAAVDVENIPNAGL